MWRKDTREEQPKEFLRHVTIAHGSLAELETLLLVAQDLQYTDAKTMPALMELCNATSRMLGGLRRKLRSKLNPKSPNP